jgi:endogenous inhibitor of DNA gyrase (YacG/DUF329 family)
MRVRDSKKKMKCRVCRKDAKWICSETHVTYCSKECQKIGVNTPGAEGQQKRARYVVRSLDELPNILELLSSYLSGQDLLNLSSTSKDYQRIFRIRAYQEIVLDISENEEINEELRDTLGPYVTKLIVSGFDQLRRWGYLDNLEWLKVIVEDEEEVMLIPPHLKHLVITGNFDQDLIGRLPVSLKSLSFEEMCIFNQPLLDLPTGLEHLKFEGILRFRQPLDRLPPRLKTFIYDNSSFDSQFAPDLANLPVSLTGLIFNMPRFPHSVDLGYLVNLKTLQITLDKNRQHMFPHGLKLLKVGGPGLLDGERIPITVKSLEVNRKILNIERLPDGIEKLEVGFIDDIERLPRNLKYFIVRIGNTGTIRMLPENLRVLVFGPNYRQKLPKIPESVTTIIGIREEIPGFDNMAVEDTILHSRSR